MQAPHQQPMDLGEPAPIDLGEPAQVIEFGSEPTARRRLWPSGFGATLAADRRAAPIAAALAAVAAFGSLAGEWQMTTVNASALLGSGDAGNQTLPSDLADLGAFGSGYLIGLFVLVAAVVLTMFGPLAGRAYARLTGLAAGGVLAALLVALISTLGDQSRLFSRLYSLQLTGNDLQVTYGRGLWCACAAVVLAVIALALAGRSAEPLGTWRRPRISDEESGPDAPIDLTVGPAAPWSEPTPGQRGISG